MLFLNNKRSWILCGITFLAGVAVFPFLPDQIPVHWQDSAPDGFAGKWAVFLFPAIQAVILLASQNPGIKKWCMMNKPGAGGNENQYYLTIFCIVLLMAFVEGVSIFWAL